MKLPALRLAKSNIASQQALHSDTTPDSRSTVFCLATRPKLSVDNVQVRSQEGSKIHGEKVHLDHQRFDSDMERTFKVGAL